MSICPYISPDPPPHAAWADFVFKQSFGNIYHTPEMADVFSNTLNYKPEILFLKTSETDIQALFPVVTLNSNNSMIDFLSRRSVSYGSPLIPSQLNPEDSARLLTAYHQKRISDPIYTELRNISDLFYLRKLILVSGFTYYDYLNYLIPIQQPVDIMLDRISRSTRKKIRKFLINPTFQIEAVTSVEQVHTCFDILKMSYDYNRVPLADKSLFLNAFEILYPKNMIRFTIATFEDKPIATSVDLLYKKTIYGWYGGFDRHFSKFLPNEMVMWHILDWGARNGFTIYDFGGAGRPEEKYGVRDFKAKFGGKLVNYGRFLSIHHPVRYYTGSAAYKTMRFLSSKCKPFLC